MTPSSQYLARARELIDTVASQESAIATAADWFAATILAGRMVHVFGFGHATALFESAYDEHAVRLAKLYARASDSGGRKS